MTHETVLSVTYASADRARQVQRAIAPEIGDIDDNRSNTLLDRERDELHLTVEASDVVALRAAINTWLSLVSVAEEVGTGPARNC